MRIAILAAVMAMAFTGVVVAGAQAADVCPQPHVQVAGDVTTIEVTAPDGYLIVGYCAKAGPEAHHVSVSPSTDVTVQSQTPHPVHAGQWLALSHYSLVLQPVNQDPDPDPCEWNPDLEASDPDCVELCEFDPQLAASDPDCEPPVDEPPVDEPPVDQPPVDEPPVDEPPVDQPPADPVLPTPGEPVPPGTELPEGYHRDASTGLVFADVESG